MSLKRCPRRSNHFRPGPKDECPIQLNIHAATTHPSLNWRRLGAASTALSGPAERTLAGMEPAKGDGVLRRVSDQTWEGYLHGYRVLVSSASGWHFAVINARGHTEVYPRVGSLAEGAPRAREWIERHAEIESATPPKE
jgi:hypothetical protein